MTYQARIFDDPGTYATGTVRLAIRTPEGAVLTGHLELVAIVEGASAAGSGIVLPAQAIDAIAEAIDAWRGTASHGATESRVLREWLAVEQRRVDESLRAAR